MPGEMSPVSDIFRYRSFAMVRFDNKADLSGITNGGKLSPMFTAFWRPFMHRNSLITSCFTAAANHQAGGRTEMILYRSGRHGGHRTRLRRPSSACFSNLSGSGSRDQPDESKFEAIGFPTQCTAHIAKFNDHGVTVSPARLVAPPARDVFQGFGNENFTTRRQHPGP